MAQRSTDLLFGSLLLMDNAALPGMAAASITRPVVALIGPPPVLGNFDSGVMAATSGKGGMWHQIFLTRVVSCVVSDFAPRPL